MNEKSKSFVHYFSLEIIQKPLFGSCDLTRLHTIMSDSSDKISYNPTS